MKKDKILLAGVVLLPILALLVGFFYGKYNQKMQTEKNLLSRDYYPIETVMELNGYNVVAEETYTWEKQVATVDVAVVFDFEKEICYKNNYEFSLEYCWVYEEETMYVHKDVLESVLNCELSCTDGETIVSTPISFAQHEWTTAFEPLVAHSGGAARRADYNAYYCNSPEVLAENYSLGHRVFEIDFYLTSDNKLAAVHDWNHQGNFDGTALSEEEWRNTVVVGQPEGEFTTMMIGDVLDEMLVNKDMFVVTDTKFTGIEALLEFQLIYDAALERDLELLDRIIPQIYNEEMYEWVMSVYDFPSVIYTTYATPATALEIIDFAAKKQNIKVITTPKDDVEFDEATIGILHDNDLLLYTHTIYSYTELTEGKAKGVDGFYTGLLLPRDMEVYNNAED